MALLERRGVDPAWVFTGYNCKIVTKTCHSGCQTLVKAAQLSSRATTEDSEEKVQTVVVESTYA